MRFFGPDAKSALRAIASVQLKKFIKECAIVRAYIVERIRKLAKDLDYVIAVVGVGSYWESKGNPIEKYKETLDLLNEKRKFTEEDSESFYENHILKIYNEEKDIDVFLIMLKKDDGIRKVMGANLNSYLDGLKELLDIKDEFKIDLRPEDVIKVDELDETSYAGITEDTGPGEKYRKDVCTGNVVILYTERELPYRNPVYFDPEPWKSLLEEAKAYVSNNGLIEHIDKAIKIYENL